jgi:hypothetical protein
MNVRDVNNINVQLKMVMITNCDGKKAHGKRMPKIEGNLGMIRTDTTKKKWDEPDIAIGRSNSALISRALSFLCQLI